MFKKTVMNLLSLFLILSFSSYASGYTDVFDSYEVEKIHHVKVDDIKFPPEKSQYDPYVQLGEYAFPSKNPYYLEFNVASDRTAYKVIGIRKLVKRMHEIYVIEKLEESSSGAQIVNGAYNSVKRTGKGFWNLAISPVRSVKNIGIAGKKAVSRVKGLFKDEKRHTGPDLSIKDKIFQAEKRNVAEEMGVDVYSDNKYLQAVLDRIARARLGGEVLLFIGKLFIPLVPIVGLTLTAGGVTGSANSLVNDLGPDDLYEKNEELLLELGVGGKIAESFLGNKNFSPREATYVCFYARDLKDVIGFRNIIRQAEKTKSKLDVQGLLLQLEMVTLYREKGGTISELFAEKDLLCFSTVTKKLVAPLPFDMFLLKKKTAKLLKGLDNLKERVNLTEKEVWCKGFITEPCQRYLDEKGYTYRNYVFENMLEVAKAA